MKVAIYPSIGSFSLTRDQTQWMADHGHQRAKGFLSEAGSDELFDIWYPDEVERTDPILIACLELNPGSCKIVEVPDEVSWTIQEYDGKEWVAEVHRTWR